MAALALLAVLGVPPAASAQVFLASNPRPDFAIGPLFINATVHPDLGPVAVNVSWSLVPAPHHLAEDIKQDLYLLWPAEAAEATAPGALDPALLRYVPERGFDVVNGGRLALRYRDRSTLGTATPGEAADVTASFVTITRRGAPPQTGVGTPG